MFAHSHSFDPSHGYTLDDLFKVPAAEGPADFADFWRRTYAEVRQIPLHIAKRQVASNDGNYHLFEIEYDSLGGARIGGWISVPKDEKIERGVVVGHGYGNVVGETYQTPGPAAVVLGVSKRGLGRSQHPAIPNVTAEHVLHGIQDKETYIHRGCVADVWCSATALLALYPEIADNLHYYGSSFGGGIGALALPWDARFKKAFLGVPTFGNHPLRITLPCTGSGKSVQEYYATHPEILDVLQYFDSSTAAKHIAIPTITSCAVFDPAVPPAGQFAVYNALRCPKEIHILPAAHFEYPALEENLAKMREKIAAWCSIGTSN